MTDEEKHAIEFVKSELQDEKIARNDYQSLTGLYGNLEIETVLNIIEKQSKEIEELKETMLIDDYKLGYWKLESTFKRGKYIRQKCYIEEDEEDKMKYTKLIGVCKDCVYKCFRCEDPKFVGVYKCKWNDKVELKQERIKI